VGGGGGEFRGATRDNPQKRGIDFLIPLLPDRYRLYAPREPFPPVRLPPRRLATCTRISCVFERGAASLGAEKAFIVKREQGAALFAREKARGFSACSVQLMRKMKSVDVGEILIF